MGVGDEQGGVWGEGVGEEDVGAGGGGGVEEREEEDSLLEEG